MAALAAVVTLSHAACGSPAEPVARPLTFHHWRAGAGVATSPGIGRLAGTVQFGRAPDGVRVVVISESTGHEYETRTQAGAFFVDVPAGSYTISVGGDDDVQSSDGEGGVVVESQRTVTVDLHVSFPVVGIYTRTAEGAPPPPLPDLSDAATDPSRSEPATPKPSTRK